MKTPYLTIAHEYYESKSLTKLPQDFKPTGFFADLHELTLTHEYFYHPHGTLGVLSIPARMDQITNYILLLSCVNEEH